MSIPGSASPLLFASVAAEAAAFKIDRSLRFNSADSAYLSRGSFANSDTKTMTFSFWLKRCAPTSVTATQYVFSGGDNGTIFFDSGTSDKLTFNLRGTSGTNFFTNTEAELRDFSAWYHIVVALDLGNATQSERFKCYINGVQQTMSATSYPNNNFHDGGTWYIGSYTGTQNYPDFYLAEFYYIAGQALAPTDFGEYDEFNNWNPKAYSGTYGTNGFHLDFSDNSSASALGTDSSGNSNTWTVNNLSVASGAGNDSLIDTPTNYEADSGNNGGNYATLNPLISTSGPLSNGNLEMTGSNAWRNTKGTISVSSGKWYFEATYTGSQYGSATSNLVTGIGFAKANVNTPNVDVTNSSIYESILAFNQTGHVNNFNAPSSARSQIASGDVIGLALNLDAGTYVIYVNNSSTSSGSLNFTGELTPWTNAYTTSDYFICNFGQRPFAYTAPSGFKSLCTTNLPDPTIADGSTAMDVKLYTGNGSTQTISGLDFSPDLVWTKMRSTTGYSNKLVDQVRGATKSLVSNNTNAELTESSGLTAFTSDGFSLGSQEAYNRNNDTFVAWTWDGGTSTVSNTDGSITSSVRANPSAGFSIVSYSGNGTSGATVGHGLNAAPGFIILKRRDSTGRWAVYYDGMSTGDYIYLDLTDPTYNDSAGWPSLPTSSVFSISSNSNWNNSSGTYVAYCFAPVSQFSAFGEYTGNGSTDGPFVYTGFRPALILLKRTDSTASWQIRDTSRSPHNVVTENLYPNLSNAESTDSSLNLDILSNGFKPRTSTDGGSNASGGTYIYACFCENPFKTARAR